MIAAEVKYKKTGIDWMPEVSEHWDVRRMKFIADVKFSTVDKHSLKEEKKIRLCNYVDVYKNEYIDKSLDFMNASASDEEIKKFTVHKGDIILTKDSETFNDIAVPALVTEQIDGLVCGYHLAQIKASENIIDSNYLFRVLQSKSINHHFSIAAKGVTRCGLSYDDISSVFIPFPPSIEEQKAIAQVIETESAKITHFIQTKQRFIELLKEQRQSIITNAVTKGIDEKAKMKETGILWIPQVPEHWEVRRLKYLVELYKHNKSTTNSNGFDFKLALENIDNWTGKYIESVSPDFEGEGRYFKVGDVLFGKLRPYLAKAFLPDKNGICVSEILVLTPNLDLITNEFLFQRILTKGFIDIVDGSTYGAKMPRAGWDFIGNMRIAYPPTIAEQKQIVEHIKTETKTIDIAISKAEREIELIKEYREAMIAEAVTGKMKC